MAPRHHSAVWQAAARILGLGRGDCRSIGGALKRAIARRSAAIIAVASRVRRSSFFTSPSHAASAEQRSLTFATSPRPSRNAKGNAGIRARIVQDLLRDSSQARDSLPYTAEFDRLHAEFIQRIGAPVDKHEFWRLLSNVGKRGGLGRGRKNSRRIPAPRLSEEEQLEIVRLLPEGLGTRDRLPYSPQLDELHRRFRRLTGRSLTKQQFWRAISHVAKLARTPKPVYETAPIGRLGQDLVEFLEFNNPWWRAQPAQPTERFRRWAFDEMVRRLETGLSAIVAVRGPRRVGKTVLQRQLVEALLATGRLDPTRRPVDPRRILNVQFDDAPALGGLSMPIQSIVRWYEDNVLGTSLNQAAHDGRPAYLLFDEVQNLPDWSVQLKQLADKTSARIIITGSSALRIARGHDNLAGRLTTIELGPLRLAEIAGIHGDRDLRPVEHGADTENWRYLDFWRSLVEHGERLKAARIRTFRRFSDRGGYPLCHATKEQSTAILRKQLLAEVIDKTIEHDPAHGSRRTPLEPRLIREVFRLACRYAGQSVRPKRLAEELTELAGATVPPARVDDAMQFLADSLLIQRVPSLEMLAKRNAAAPKLCICDPFVRNGYLQETVPLCPEELRSLDQAVATQAGHLIESVIGYFLRGVTGVELAWFPERSGQPEVDFVLTLGSQRIPIEVKYRSGDAPASAARGVTSFCEKAAYGAKFGIVITQDFGGLVDERTIAIPASSFLLLR